MAVYGLGEPTHHEVGGSQLIGAGHLKTAAGRSQTRSNGVSPQVDLERRAPRLPRVLTDFRRHGRSCPRDVAKLKHFLRERLRWGSWNAHGFGLCRVRVHKKEDHSVALDQLSLVDTGIALIAVDRHRDLADP